jgi:hypothetical protein
MRTTVRTRWIALAAAALFFAPLGCASRRYDPALATRPYPRDLHQDHVVDVQVFRDDTRIEITNSTARSYHDFDLWINQRYVRRVESLEAGQMIRLSLWDFFDQWGQSMIAGGLWRTVPPTPVMLVEIQVDDQQPLTGLVAVRTDPITVRPVPRRR